VKGVRVENVFERALFHEQAQLGAVLTEGSGAALDEEGVRGDVEVEVVPVLPVRAPRVVDVCHSGEVVVGDGHGVDSASAQPGTDPFPGGSRELEAVVKQNKIQRDRLSPALNIVGGLVGPDRQVDQRTGGSGGQ
jgi:hypothetical protein